MMRSEKRPGYRAPEPPRRRNRKRKKPDIPYVCITFLMLLILFPVGLVMLWLRKIYWSAATKMVITVAFAAVFVLAASFALTVPVDNVTVTNMQLRGRQALANAGTEVQEAWTRADVSPEHMLKNAQDIAGHSIQLVQKTLINGLPVLKQNMDNIAQNARDIAEYGAGAVVSGTKGLLYKANLLPTPEPTPIPSPTPEPTAEPTPSPTETPAPLSLMAWYASGDALYHLKPDCTVLDGKSTQPMSVTEAAHEGLMPCEVCSAEEGIGKAEAPDETRRPEGAGPEPIESVDAGSATPVPVRDEVINTIDGEQVVPSVPGGAPDLALVEPSPDPGAVVTPPPPTPTPVPTPVPTPMVLPEAKQAGLATVYFTSNGKYYHTGPNCGSMRGAKPHTFQEAVDAGLKRCNGCGSPDPELLQAAVVVWRDDDQVFHITDECAKLSGDKPKLMSLEQAMQEEGLKGCKECGADLYAQVAKLYPADTPVPASPIGD